MPPASLPQIVPLFPLSGVLLLPRGQLPLHVFEERYRNMTSDALRNEKMIGVIQPFRPAQDPIPTETAVFETGCVGKIVESSQTSDGRYIITLEGVCRFSIAAELEPQAGYRRARANYRSFLEDLQEPSEGAVDRTRLIGAAQGYLGVHQLTTDWSVVELFSDEELVTTLAMACPFEPSEKQALLESPTLTDRGQLLTALMEISAHVPQTTEREIRH